ncbi:MAG: hypothetical protein ABI625_20965 [bacterium]
MTTDPARPPNNEWLSEDDAHRVLARAVELDSRATTDVSLTQLREVAIEAGIAPNALEQALTELRTSRLPREGTLDASASHASTASRSLSHSLIRYRRHAAVLIAIGIAALTPGDVFLLDVLGALPIYALYELCVRIARAREGTRGRPQGPRGANDVVAESAPRPIDVPDRISRALLLRPA